MLFSAAAYHITQRSQIFGKRYRNININERKAEAGKTCDLRKRHDTFDNMLCYIKLMVSELLDGTDADNL